MIVNEKEESRKLNKHLFRNHLQNLCPIPKMHKAPESISMSIVDAMRVVRMIPIAGLKPRIFKSWADSVMSHFSSFSGRHLHIIFDDYGYVYNIPSKQRAVSQVERVMNSLNQDLPPTKEWDEFLMNQKNKLQIENLLVDYIKTDIIKNKAFIVNRGSECFFIDHGTKCIRMPELDSPYREADQKIPMHAVYAGRQNSDTVCIIAEDTDIYLSLISISHLVQSNLIFRQGKTKDRDGITYHDVHAMADHLGEDICAILLSFHGL